MPALRRQQGELLRGIIQKTHCRVRPECVFSCHGSRHLAISGWYIRIERRTSRCMTMEQILWNRKRLRRVLIHLAAMCAALAVGCIILLFTPLRIPCPLYMWFGILCPFCGGTRMAEALLQLDIAGAFACNPYLLISIPMLVLLFSWREWVYLRRGTYRFSAGQRALLLLIGCSGILFGILRNFIP